MDPASSLSPSLALSVSPSLSVSASVSLSRLWLCVGTGRSVFLCFRDSLHLFLSLGPPLESLSFGVSLSLSACQGLFDFLCVEPYGDPSLLGFFLSGSPLFLIFCPLGSLSALGFYDFRLQSAVLWFIDDATSL